MKRNFLLLFLNFFIAFPLLSQNVETIKYEKFKEIMNDRSSDIQVINFWATWCKPCIKELPFFEKIHNQYKNNNVKVVLVSVDFVEELENKVIPFVIKRKLQSEVKLLDETDFNFIINDIDSSWSGAIPATLIINNITGESDFYEKEFKEGELDLIIKAHLEKF